MPRALISVSDKTGVVDFARALAALGWEIVSTGGTSRTLRDAGIDTIDVRSVTQHPEMMDGRVKTLHPAVHAGILARPGSAPDDEALRAHGYASIDLVAVNLYPFHEAVARGASIADAMEQVDIGGPSMLRSAAKNHARVIALVDPADYPRVVEALRRGSADSRLRRELAGKVFAHTSAYDAAIAAYFAKAETPDPEPFAEAMHLTLRRVQSLRYGENPDQRAAFYAGAEPAPGSLAGLSQVQGKELSFNNLLDADAALAAVRCFADQDRPVCAIIKHTTPCGVAVADSQEEAYRNALACDPVSAFGGIVAFNAPLSAAAALALRELFIEIVLAPSFSDEARELLASRKNLRLLEVDVSPSAGALDFKRVAGGFLVQDAMSLRFPEMDWKVVTKRAPTPQEMEDLRFAWRVSALVKSNAIVLARGGRTIGIGGGQTSRVDASRLAVAKAEAHGHATAGASLASDAFFPFADGVEAAAAAGVRALVQPGGSVRDEEVIAAADARDLAMIFTSRRLFRH